MPTSGGREPVPERQPAADLLIGQERPAQPRRGHRGGVQEVDVGSAQRGDAAGDLVRLEARVDLVERGDGGDEVHAVQRRELPRASDLLDRAAPRHGHRVAGRQLEPRDLLDGGRDEDVQSAPARGGHHDHAPEAERGAERLRQALGRRGAADLDVDDPLVARELQHPRHRRPRHAEPLRDLLLRELVAVVELGRIRQFLHRCAGQMFRHVVGLYQTNETTRK